MLYNSPRNDQLSAKTAQTSLTDLSLAIGTAYESIHTFVFSHEKSLIRDFLLLIACCLGLLCRINKLLHCGQGAGICIGCEYQVLIG